MTVVINKSTATTTLVRKKRTDNVSAAAKLLTIVRGHFEYILCYNVSY